MITFKQYVENNQEVMYHVTSKERLPNILLNGLKIGSEWGFSEGAKEVIEKIYGTRPIFLSYKPWPNLTQRQLNEGILLQVNVSGLPLVADIPSLADRGAYYDDAEPSMYWREGKEPAELSRWIDEEGQIYFEDIITPGPMADAIIAFTGTAAVIQDIPTNRITKI